MAIKMVEDMVPKFQDLRCSNETIELNFLDSHVDYFLENLGAYGEEQGERFNQDLKETVSRYQGK